MRSPYVIGCVMWLVFMVMAGTGYSSPGFPDRERVPGERSPSLAFATALVPGAVFHGLGNYYAGDRRTATILFSLEMLGLGLLMTNRQSSSGRTGGGAGIVGGGLFVGTWLYDVMTAPEAAERRNTRLREEHAFSVGIEPLSATIDDPLQPTFRFTHRF